MKHSIQRKGSSVYPRPWRCCATKWLLLNLYNEMHKRLIYRYASQQVWKWQCDNVHLIACNSRVIAKACTLWNMGSICFDGQTLVHNLNHVYKRIVYDVNIVVYVSWFELLKCQVVVSIGTRQVLEIFYWNFLTKVHSLPFAMHH